MIVRRCWMLLAMAIVVGNSLADPPSPLPPGMGQYIVVLWDPGTPIPGDPHGRKMKPIPEPDIEGMGGKVLERKYNRRVIILPRGAAKQLARHTAVAYLQRVWMGEALEGEEDFSTDLRSDPTGQSDVDLTWGPHAYAYDGSGNITAIGPDSYTYDSAGRLIRATVKGKTETYKYDAFGNLVEKTGNTTVAIPVDPGSNRIIGVTYDEVGNITEQAPSAYLYAGGYTVPGLSSYSYDSLGMLTAYERPGNTTVQMIYDANDERVGHMIDIDTVRWTIRDFEGQVLREYKSEAIGDGVNWNWEWTQDHIRGGGHLIGGELQTWDFEEIVVWGGKCHYHLDHLGSVRIVTDEQGRSLSENDYYPFGVNETKFFQQQATLFNGHIDRMRFAGHMRDFYGAFIESKEYLDYMHARYYDPNLGRFLSVDPVLDVKRALRQPQAWNRYSYVINNPLKYVDPTGKVFVLSDDEKKRNEQLAFVKSSVSSEAASHLTATQNRQGQWVLGITGTSRGDFAKMGEAAHGLAHMIGTPGQFSLVLGKSAQATSGGGGKFIEDNRGGGTIYVDNTRKPTQYPGYTQSHQMVFVHEMGHGLQEIFPRSSFRVGRGNTPLAQGEAVGMSFENAVLREMGLSRDYYLFPGDWTHPGHMNYSNVVP